MRVNSSMPSGPPSRDIPLAENPPQAMGNLRTRRGGEGAVSRADRQDAIGISRPEVKIKTF
jgi:hypothetical protein